jgi:hypothetical protein
MIISWKSDAGFEGIEDVFSTESLKGYNSRATEECVGESPASSD